MEIIMTRSDDIPDVPDISADWYRDIVSWADDTPPMGQTFMEYFTDVGLLLLVGLWALALWRARRGSARPMAVALVGAVGAVVAYVVSELAKGVLSVERPCRTMPSVAIVADQCPPTGDWSFPSNHATIAVALGVVILLTSWRLGLLALPIAALTAFSRVFLGVHYPHDVIAGVLVGVMVTVTVILLLRHPGARLVTHLREHTTWSRLLTTGPPPLRKATRKDRETAARD
jgi:membrane-associated phospholipid phosphatase